MNSAESLLAARQEEANARWAACVAALQKAGMLLTDEEKEQLEVAEKVLGLSSGIAEPKPEPKAKGFNPKYDDVIDEALRITEDLMK